MPDEMHMLVTTPSKVDVCTIAANILHTVGDGSHFD